MSLASILAWTILKYLKVVSCNSVIAWLRASARDRRGDSHKQPALEPSGALVGPLSCLEGEGSYALLDLGQPANVLLCDRVSFVAVSGRPTGSSTSIMSLATVLLSLMMSPSMVVKIYAQEKLCDDAMLCEFYE